MKTKSLFWSRLGGLGVAYAVLFVVGYVLMGSAPSAKASGAEVISYYHSHKASEIAGVFVVAVAVVAFSFFLASLRQALTRTGEGRELAQVVTAGGAVYVVGLLFMDALTVALVDTGRYALTGPAQTLNVLSNDAWVPVVAGISITALGTGLVALRHATLPKWLAWASIALGVLALAGPAGGIAFLLVPIWGLVTGVVLMRSGSRQVVAADSALSGLSPANS